MSTRRSRTEAAVPLGADDFQHIRGIGSGVAQRLYGAGVHSFAQLAELTPEAIAALVSDIAGLSAARITALDWIGQARQLIPEQPATMTEIPEAELAEPQAEVDVLQNRQHYSAFKVEFLLNKENELRRTKVTHVLDGAEDVWAGWHEERLSDFFIRHAQLHLPQAARPEPAPTVAKEPQAAEHAAATAAMATAAPTITSVRSALALHAIEALPDGADTPRPILLQGQPFVIRLALDLADGTTNQRPLDYTATIYAKSLEGQGRHTVGQAIGQIGPSHHATINMVGKALPPGIFRLEALVIISSAHPHEDMRAHCEGSLLQVL